MHQRSFKVILSVLYNSAEIISDEASCHRPFKLSLVWCKLILTIRLLYTLILNIERETYAISSHRSR